MQRDRGEESVSVRAVDRSAITTNAEHSSQETSDRGLLVLDKLESATCNNAGETKMTTAKAAYNPLMGILLWLQGGYFITGVWPLIHHLKPQSRLRHSGAIHSLHASKR
jgi:hypothetical protein